MFIYITFFLRNRANYKSKYDYSIHLDIILYVPDIIIHTLIYNKVNYSINKHVIYNLYIYRILQKKFNFRVAENLIKFEINLVYFRIQQMKWDANN